MFKEYDVVALKRKVPGIPLPTSTEGTVLLVRPGSTPHYEIEFTDSKGKFFSPTYTISEDDLTLIWEYDGR
jgi:hypothetical protein